MSGVNTRRQGGPGGGRALVGAGRQKGFQLPVTSYALQAMVSEPVKPVLNTVTLSPSLGAYWSQSDKARW